MSVCILISIYGNITPTNTLPYEEVSSPNFLPSIFENFTPMKTTVIDGKELAKGQKFAEVKDKKIQFYKLIDFNVSKPGKHGSAKKIIKATNLFTMKTYETTYGGNVNVFLIDDFEYQLLPIEMIDQNFSEFCYDMENDLHVSTNQFELSSVGMLEFFKAANFNRSVDDLLQDSNGSRLCLLVNDANVDGVEAKFLWDIVYVQEDSLNKKIQPGALPSSIYNQYMASIAPEKTNK